MSKIHRYIFENKKNYCHCIATKNWPSLQFSWNRESKFLPIKPIKSNIALVFNQWNWSITAFRWSSKEYQIMNWNIDCFCSPGDWGNDCDCGQKQRWQDQLLRVSGWSNDDGDDDYVGDDGFGQMVKMVVIIMRNKIFVCCFILILILI